MIKRAKTQTNLKVKNNKKKYHTHQKKMDTTGVYFLIKVIKL